MVETLARGKHTVFAKECGIPTPTFQAYYHGERNPSSEHLIKIKSRFGINLNWLLSGEGEPFIQEGVETRTPEAGKMVPFKNDAVRLVEEAIQEAEVSVTDIQKQHLVGIIAEEMKLLTHQLVRALKRGTIREYNP